MTRPPEAGVREYQSRWNQAAAKQLLWAVKIGQNEVQQSSTLDQSCFHLAPFRRRDHKGNGIQSPRPIHSQRIAINIVRNAVFPNSLPCRFPAAGYFLPAKCRQRIDESVPMGTKNREGGVHLVVNPSRLGIAGAQEWPVHSV